MQKKNDLQTGIRLLERFVEMKWDDASFTDMILQIIEVANAHGAETVGGGTYEQLVRKAFVNAFVQCVNAYGEKLWDSILRPIRTLANWLSPGQKIPAGGKMLTVGEVMKEIEQIADMTCLHKLQKTKPGSRDQKLVVQEVIRYLNVHQPKVKIEGLNVAEISKNLLLKTYIENTKRYEEVPEKTGREIMRLIAAAMPSDMELPGSGMTLWEFDDRMEPTHELTRIRQLIDDQCFETSDVDILSYYVRYWPDFDLGGQTFREVAKSFIHAMLVISANQAQKTSGDTRNKWVSRLLATVDACTACRGVATMQELEVAGKICQYNSSARYYPSNYKPSCPPLRNRDYVRKGSSSSNGKQGLLGRLKGRFGK